MTVSPPSQIEPRDPPFPVGSLQSLVLICSIALLAMGCEPSGSREAQGSRNQEAQESVSHSTPIVFVNVDNGFHLVPIPLTTDYGFLVLNSGDDEHPTPVVAVGFRQERRVIRCLSLTDFEAALRRIPAGKPLHRHERCLMPASRGLADEFLTGIDQTLSRVGVTVAPEPVITCLCGR